MQSVGYTKGWTRSTCAVLTMVGIKENDLIDSEGVNDALKKSFATIHATVGNFQDDVELVLCNRGLHLKPTIADMFQ
jgi:hypothetical protein